MERELASLRARYSKFRENFLTRRQRRNEILSTALEVAKPSKRALAAVVVMLLRTSKQTQRQQLRALLGNDLFNELTSTETFTLGEISSILLDAFIFCILHLVIDLENATNGSEFVIEMYVYLISLPFYSQYCVFKSESGEAGSAARFGTERKPQFPDAW